MKQVGNLSDRVNLLINAGEICVKNAGRDPYISAHICILLTDLLEQRQVHRISSGSMCP